MISSLANKSVGNRSKRCREDPKSMFTHERKNIVGANRYRSKINHKESKGYRSKKNEKKSISATNMIDPGNPRKTNKFSKLTKKSFGHIKFTPFISVIKRVLNRRPTLSTSKNEFVDNKAWLINIQKLANIKDDCPLITQIVSQCISTTVE